MRWSIRYQLLVPLLTLLVGVVAMSVWAALASAHQARGQMKRQVRQIAATVHDSTYRLTERVLQLMKGLSGADYLFISKENLEFTTLDTRPQNLPPPEVKGGEQDRLALEQRIRLQDGVYFCSGVRLTKGPNAGGVLYIFYAESLWRDLLWQAVRPSLVFGIMGGGLAIVLTIVLAQRLTRRVQEFEKRTRLIADGDFSPMPMPRRDDELRDLTRSVNEMALRLAEYQAKIQKNERLRLLGQIGGGLAHQLRNGVTGARLAVQVHARDCSNTGDTESLEVALRQLALLELHLKRFLELGREREQKHESCSVPALLEETMTLLGPQCKHAHICVDLQVPENCKGCRITGDPAQLTQVFLNVISNAIEAAGPGGAVAVDLTPPVNQRLQIRISDTGEGPNAEVAERLFEPFVTAKPDGVGLGLAVARQIVEAHQGSIRWQRESERTNFIIELPAEQST